jgi:IS1 family transposase
MDEFWSYVQNKGNQRWTWYAMERQSGVVPAWLIVNSNILKVFDGFLMQICFLCGK